MAGFAIKDNRQAAPLPKIDGRRALNMDDIGFKRIFQPYQLQMPVIQRSSHDLSPAIVELIAMGAFACKACLGSETGFESLGLREGHQIIRSLMQGESGSNYPAQAVLRISVRNSQSTAPHQRRLLDENMFQRSGGLVSGQVFHQARAPVCR